VNWILADDLAKEHLDAIHRSGANARPRWERESRRPGRIRRAIGVKFVGAGLGIAAGVRTAKSASDVVCAARDGLISEGS
jgi:hypothetical protein